LKKTSRVAIKQAYTYTNFTTAKTQIEAPFCTGCAETTERASPIPLQLSEQIISGIRNGRKILLASTHIFHLLAPHHWE